MAVKNLIEVTQEFDPDVTLITLLKLFHYFRK